MTDSNIGLCKNGELMGQLYICTGEWGESVGLFTAICLVRNRNLLQVVQWSGSLLCLSWKKNNPYKIYLGQENDSLVGTE